jgi:hypothetical protein
MAESEFKMFFGKPDECLSVDCTDCAGLPQCRRARGLTEEKVDAPAVPVMASQSIIDNSRGSLIFEDNRVGVIRD